MTIELFDDTPEHRDNFIKLVEEGFYNDLLFHRVIKALWCRIPQSGAAPRHPGYRRPGTRLKRKWTPHLHLKGR